MRIADTIVTELEREAANTVRMLERVPNDRLEWRPHTKSMSLRQLAWHLAVIPKRVGAMLRAGEFDLLSARPDPASESAGDIVGEFQRNLQAVHAQIGAMDDDAMRERLTLRRGEKIVTTFSKAGVIRTILMNHSVHHRGQLSVYLRLLDVPVPAMYGTSADEP